MLGGVFFIFRIILVSIKNTGIRIEMYAGKSQKSKVELYILKYCKVSIPKHIVRNISKVLFGVKKRVQILLNFAIYKPLNKIYAHAGPTISSTYPFQKVPKSNQIVDRPIPNKIIKIVAQYGAYLSCILIKILLFCVCPFTFYVLLFWKPYYSTSCSLQYIFLLKIPLQIES